MYLPSLQTFVRAVTNFPSLGCPIKQQISRFFSSTSKKNTQVNYDKAMALGNLGMICVFVRVTVSAHLRNYSSYELNVT